LRHCPTPNPSPEGEGLKKSTQFPLNETPAYAWATDHSL
jgi:hypothetical protein